MICLNSNAGKHVRRVKYQCDSHRGKMWILLEIVLFECVCARTNRSDCHAKRWQKRLFIFSAGFVICIEVTLLSIKKFHLQRSHNRICLVKLLWNFFIQLEFVDWHCILSSGNEEKQTNTDWALRGALLCVQTKYLFEKNRWIGFYHSIQFD